MNWADLYILLNLSVFLDREIAEEKQILSPDRRQFQARIGLANKQLFFVIKMVFINYDESDVFNRDICHALCAG
ncbi:hypothetical protein EBU02_10000 [bacterium]|nr:hypothetical protein [bacterium]